MSETPTGGQYEHKTPHLTVYLVWPLALGIAIPLVISAARLGVLWKKQGGEVAFDKASNTFLWLWPVVTIGAMLFVVWQWAGPRVIEAMRQTQIIREQPGQMQHHWTRLGGRAAQSTNTPTSIQVRRSRGWLRDLLGKRQTVYNLDAEEIEPRADEWVKEAYDVICTLWNQDLTRAAFQRNWPSGGTEMYYRYVAGKDGAKGWFDQWNVIEQADKRGKMRFSCKLEDVFRADDDLWTYASQVRQLSPTLTNRLQDRVGG